MIETQCSTLIRPPPPLTHIIYVWVLVRALMMIYTYIKTETNDTLDMHVLNVL